MHLLQQSSAGNFFPQIVGIAGFLITVLSFFFLAFFILSRKRQNKLVEEQEALQIEFEKQLLKTQLEIQEQTFNTISLEIHDNVGQILSLAKVQLNIIDQKETLDKELLADAKESVGNAMDYLRDIAQSLNSERIQLGSISELAQKELQRINRSQVMKAEFSLHGNEREIQSQKKLIIFRIIQEILNNTLKHSKAGKIRMIITYESERLTISIEDNGVGFRKDMTNKKSGLGLQNIVSRTTLIGGTADIESLIHKGTVITITIPI